MTVKLPLYVSTTPPRHMRYMEIKLHYILDHGNSSNEWLASHCGCSILGQKTTKVKRRWL